MKKYTDIVQIAKPKFEQIFGRSLSDKEADHALRLVMSVIKIVYGGDRHDA